MHCARSCRARALAGAALVALVSLAVPARAEEPFPTPEDILASFTVAAGYQVNLFASERDFPIANPIAMAFDPEGRLWVACSTTYPIYDPGHAPDDKIVVLEDTDGDGAADRHVVFADHLYVPTGLALDTRGIVWVAQQPNLWKLVDSDGDLVADTRQVVLHGFATEDSHHAIHAFTWDPGGGFTMNEGVFHHTQVETPYGPRRAIDAACFRFEPRTGRLEVVSHRGYANPWGHAFDRWGQSVFSDASGGDHFSFGQVIAAFDYPEKSLPAPSFLNRGRPMAGNAILSSSHFPPEVQGTHVNNQSIGFQGVRWDRLVPHGSGWRSEELPDLLQASDPVFRPVAAKVGGDGALYVLDWSNRMLGHMQYTHRDPGRDRAHGRVWRVTCKGRPLLVPPPVTGRPVAEVLELLASPENHTRHFARRELQTRPALEVLPELRAWLAAQDPAAPELAHHRLEALWVTQGLGATDGALLRQLLASADARARAAAARVVRHELQSGALDATIGLELLAPLVEDDSQVVRLEAVGALGFVPAAARERDAGTAALDAAGRSAAGLCLLAAEQEQDRGMRAVLEQTLRVLARHGDPQAVRGRRWQLTRLALAELRALAPDAMVASVLLCRADSVAADRDSALAWLAAAGGTTRAAVLVTSLELLQQTAGDLAPVAELLRAEPVPEVAPHAARLVALVRASDEDASRRQALACLVHAESGLGRAVATAGAAAALDAVALLHDPAVLEGCAAEVTARLPVAAPAPLPVAQLVRVELPRTGILSLAEVEVIAGGRNVAPAGTATQSSTQHGGVPERAIDGDSDGAYGHGSVTHTRDGNVEKNPWWEVDLGQPVAIERVRVWNRTEEELGRRLDGFTLSLLDAERNPVWVKRAVAAPEVMVELGEAPSPAEEGAALAAAAHIPSLRAPLFAAVASARARGGALAAAAERALELVPRAEWPAALASGAAADIDPEVLARGKAVYEAPAGCMLCHQPSGQGVPGAFPPLVGSAWVTGSSERTIKIVLHGMQGPVEVQGRTYASAMAPLGAVLGDQQVADVLTYVRNSWGNRAPAVTATEVAAVRAAGAARTQPWTAAELTAAHPLER